MPEKLLHEFTYVELCAIAREIVASAESHRNLPDTSGMQLDFERAGELLRRREVERFRYAMASKSQLSRAFVELFLTSRFRTYSLAYLSVQEGEDFEGSDQFHRDEFRGLLRFCLRELGKGLRIRFAVVIFRRRFVLDVDPFCHLRAIFYHFVRCTPRTVAATVIGPVSFRFHRLLFSVKLRLFEFVVARYHQALSRRGEVVTAWVADKNISRHMRFCLTAMIPGARHLTELEWHELASRIQRYLAPRFVELLRVIPTHSLKNHGLAKLLKVAVGVIAGRGSTCTSGKAVSADFIFDTVRLAYCWGITYPLVDNVLDSAQTNAECRQTLNEVLLQVFSTTNVGATSRKASDQLNPTMHELVVCLEEVLSVVQIERIHSTKKILALLHQSHQRDADRRLSSLEGDEARACWLDVLVDTAMKSAMVRLATMCLCGISVNREVIQRALEMGLFNQLGDDLWDVSEDLADDRVTPFTLYVRHTELPNPVRFYFDYSAFLAAKLSRRRATAVLLGVCETLRDSLVGIESPTNDHISSRDLNGLIVKSTGVNVDTLKQIDCAPHLDPDAVLFAFEGIAFEMSPAS